MTYGARAAAQAERLRQSGAARVLAIETSCDETAAAVVENGRHVLSNVVHTQIPLHRQYGGVVPEIASRSHVEALPAVTQQALADAGLTLEAIDAVCVTSGPGLVGALLTGVSFAKGLALAADRPLVGVNHIVAHIAANYLTYPELAPPFTCLVASGGHSHILTVAAHGSYTLLGRTRDDAAGEAFDKAARALGLPYPGGPELERLARDGDPSAFRFHSAFNEGDGYDMSFSGIKTAVVNVLHTAEQRGESLRRADVAASFQHAVVSTLTHKAVRAALADAEARGGPAVLALAGGVSANGTLRESLKRAAEQANVRFCCPDVRYCTDNAAMVGSAGFYRLMAGGCDSLALNAAPEPFGG